MFCYFCHLSSGKDLLKFSRLELRPKPVMMNDKIYMGWLYVEGADDNMMMI